MNLNDFKNFVVELFQVSIKQFLLVLPTLTSPMIIVLPTRIPSEKALCKSCQLDFLRFVLVCCSIWLHALPSFSCPSASPIVSNGMGF